MYLINDMPQEKNVSSTDLINFPNGFRRLYDKGYSLCWQGLDWGAKELKEEETPTNLTWLYKQFIFENNKNIFSVWYKYLF